MGIIEGIIYATMSNEEFDRRYNQSYSVQSAIIQRSESVVNKPTKTEMICSAVVGWSSAKLRSDSKATSSVLYHLPQGTKVEVVAQLGEWVKVIVPQMHLQGWMFKNSLDNLESSKDK